MSRGDKFPNLAERKAQPSLSYSPWPRAADYPKALLPMGLLRPLGLVSAVRELLVHQNQFSQAVLVRLSSFPVLDL